MAKIMGVDINQIEWSLSNLRIWSDKSLLHPPFFFRGALAFRSPLHHRGWIIYAHFFYVFLFYAVSIEIAYPIPVISLPPHQLIPQGELRWTTACPGKEKGDSIQPQITADFCERAFTMSPDQSQYIWRKTISHIEVVLGSGVFPVLQWCPPGMTFQIFVPANGLFLRASMGTHWTRFDWQLYVPFHSLKEVSASHSLYM